MKLETATIYISKLWLEASLDGHIVMDKRTSRELETASLS